MTDETESPAMHPSPSSEPPPHPAELAFPALRALSPDVLLRVVLVALLVMLVWPMLMPTLLGGLAAIVLRPVDDRIAARLGRLRAASSGIVTGLSIVCVLTPILFVTYRIFLALNAFVAELLAGDIGGPRQLFLDVLGDVFGTSVDRDAIAGGFDDTVRKLGTALAGALANLARAVPEVVTDLFLFVLALYFGLRDGPGLVAWARRVSPVSSRRTKALFDAIRRSVNGTLISMAVVGGVQAGLAFVAMVACRVPHALLWAFVALVCSVLPIVGTAPVTIGASAWLFVHHRPIAAVAMIGSALVIGVSDNLVRPWVQSSHDDVHPLLALLSIFGGLAIFGPAGLLLGPVIASMAVWAIETHREDRKP